MNLRNLNSALKQQSTSETWQKVVSSKALSKKGTVEPVKNQALAQKSGLMQAERGTSADVSVPISWAFHDIDSIKPLTRFRLYLCATGLFHQLHCPKRSEARAKIFSGIA